MNDTRKALCENLCRALEEDRSRGTDLPLDQVAGAVAVGEIPSLERGQIWSAISDNEGDLPTLLALTHVSEGLRGVLVTEDTYIAGHDDVIVPKSESPTGTELLLCAWSDTPVPRNGLKGYVGEIATGVMNALYMLLQRQLTGGFHLRARGAVEEG